MSIDIDTTGAITRPADLRRLVEAVVAASPEDEANWIEWKSTLSLRAPGGWFSISRQILGLANRTPDGAARFMAGKGYLVVGAEAGKITGIEPVDVAELDNWLRPYLGDEAPFWNPTYLTFDDKTVLVITVEAPGWGDPIWTLRKAYWGEGGGAGAGTVFIRRGASIERANAAEMDMLQRRLLRGALQAPLELDLGWLDGTTIVRPIDVGTEQRRLWLEAERGALLACLANPRKHFTASIDSSLPRALGGLLEPDRRTEKEFRDELEQYLTACEQALVAQTVAYCIEQGTNRIRLAATNRSDRNLPDVELTLNLPGTPVQAFRGVHPDWPLLPNRPRILGKAVMKLPFSNFDSSSIFLPPPFTGELLSRLVIDNSGSASLTFRVGDVRPRATVELEEFHVVAGVVPGSIIHGQWSATSTRLDGVQDGRFDIRVAGEPITPLQAIPTERNASAGD
jgi:hypothetical protein